MDKKRFIKNLLTDDLKGFEEFIDSQPDDSPSSKLSTKKETPFEHFTFLTNDAVRLKKVKDLLMNKVPFATKFEQGEQLLKDQQSEVAVLKMNLFEICNKPDSTYRKSVQEIFDSFFEPPKN